MSNSNPLWRLAAAVVVVFGVSFVARPAISATDRFSAVSRHPNPDTGRYFFTQGSESLPSLRFTLGMIPIYDNWPLKIEVDTNYVSRTGTTTVSSRDRGIEHLAYDYFYGALGLSDRIGIGVDFPLFFYDRYFSPTTAARTSETKSFKPGDIRVSAKFNIVDLKTSPVGFALIPAVSAPTGDQDLFLGDDGVTGELRAVVEGKPHERVNLALNIAYQTRTKKVEFNNIKFRDRLDFALAAAWRVAREVALIAEAEALTPTTDFFGSKASSPAEARAGVRWEPGSKGWTVGMGGSVGIVNGTGMPRYSGFLNVAYSSANRVKKQKPVEEVRTPIDGVENCFSIPDGTGGHYRAVCRAYFDFDSSTLEQREAINAIVDFVRQSQGTVAVDVRGWTDPVGSSSYNQRLSMRRARYVAGLIEEALGDARSRVEIRVLGIGEDIVAPHEVGRRAEVIVK